LGIVEQGEILAEHGRIAQAMALYAEAVKLTPDITISASTWNHLCIRGCVWGLVADVIDYCNLAVTLAPDDDGMLFGLGLARALTSDYAGAIKDFERYVEWTKENDFYDPYGIEIEAFIVELEQGRNPFDEEQLGKWR
jgi:hypothetical protein